MEKQITWILLRGLGRETGHWAGFVDKFQTQFSGDRVLAIDYPGVGTRKSERAPLSIDGLADAVAVAIPTFEPQNTVVIGHSLGGMVALSMAYKFPELRGVVLINTSASNVSSWHERMVAPAMLQMAEIFALTDPKAREERVLKLVSRQPQSHGDILHKWIQLAQERPIDRQVVLKQLWASARFKTPKTAPKVPVLIMAGMGDSLVSPGCSQALGERLGTAVKFHPWAGHELTIDDPTWVLSELRTWQAATSPTP